MDADNKLLMDAVAAINARFSNGNSVPVDRAWVTEAEWKSLQFALSLALTPPEGYVLVPVDAQKDADRFRFIASWAGAEFNAEKGCLRWYLSRKDRGFASLAETVDQCLSVARPEVP